jgi:GNAT superfamily N-acetyltransferase
MPPIQIERPDGADAIAEFVALHERVYADRPAHWQASPLHAPMLLGLTPVTAERELQPFVARRGGELVARVCAAVDRPYMRHWNEKLGHLLMFEALPDARDAVRALLDAACTWLAGRGLPAARTGMGIFDMPYNTDAYEALPPSMLRQNGPHVHAAIKGAGFETEQGFVDYAVAVTPEHMARWRDALESARRAGFEIAPFRALEREERARLLCELWNETFASHWGWTPLAAEVTALFVGDDASGLDTSVFAFEDGHPVGFCFVMPDDPEHARLAPGRALRPQEKLNMLAIGVRRAARGRGVNYAMAAHAFVELARRGWTHVSYTLVLDDNWASRRTGEGLGGEVCANYVAYRRSFQRGIR